MSSEDKVAEVIVAETTSVASELVVAVEKQTDKVISGVVNEIDKAIESVGIDSSLVEPVISEIKETVSTVVSVGITQVTEKLGLKMISESTLTVSQKQLATKIYDTTKTEIQSFISDANINSTIKITKTMSQVIKQLESVSVDGHKPTGLDKKAVALQLGRILIKEVVPDDKGEAEILMLYDLVAEPTLDAMIDVSKVVNVAIQEITTKCCPGLMEILKRR
jgi:hypothetical protein